MRAVAMLVRTKKGAGGERYWVVTLGTVVVEQVPFLFFATAFAYMLSAGQAPIVAVVCFAALVAASLWHSVQVIRHGIEFRDDSIIVHGLGDGVVIFRDELRAVRCWYDANRGVRFEFVPAHELASGKRRSRRTTADLRFASLWSPKDIRRIAVLMQRWWQAEPPPQGSAPVVRQVIPMIWGSAREEALAHDRNWSVLYEVIDEGLASQPVHPVASAVQADSARRPANLDTPELASDRRADAEELGVDGTSSPRKRRNARLFAWTSRVPEIGDSAAWWSLIWVKVPIYTALFSVLCAGPIWLLQNGKHGYFSLGFFFLMIYLPTLLGIEWGWIHLKVSRRRAIAAGAMKYAPVTVDRVGVTVRSVPKPWSVTWDDLVICSSAERGFELSDRRGGSSGRIHVASLLSTRPFDGHVADDASMVQLLSALAAMAPERRNQVIDPRRTRAPYWRYAVDWPVLPDCDASSAAGVDATDTSTEIEVLVEALSASEGEGYRLG